MSKQCFTTLALRWWQKNVSPVPIRFLNPCNYRNFPTIITTPSPRIYTRDPRPPIIPPRVLASPAMGFNLGVFRFYWSHMQKEMQSKCVHDFRAPCGFLLLIVFTLRTQYMQITYTPDGPWLFWLQENLKTPNLSPIPGSRWRRFWYLWSISLPFTVLLLRYFNT